MGIILIEEQGEGRVQSRISTWPRWLLHAIKIMVIARGVLAMDNHHGRFGAADI